MACKLVMPFFGHPYGKIVRWHKNDGDFVEDGDLLVTVETRKATFDMYAPCSGFLKIYFRVGDTVPAGEVIAEIV